MKVKIFIPNKDGKIEFDQKDLESLLNEVYEEGYIDGKKNSFVPLNYPIDTKEIDKNNPFRWVSDSTSTTSFPTTITSAENIKVSF